MPAGKGSPGSFWNGPSIRWFCQRKGQARRTYLYHATYNVLCSPFAHPRRNQLVRGGGGYAAVSNLHHDVHHLKVVLQLPLRFGDVPRIPGICFLCRRSEDNAMTTWPSHIVRHGTTAAVPLSRETSGGSSRPCHAGVTERTLL